MNPTDKNKLFDLYIRPELRYIRNVCWKFCRDKNCCDEYYSDILATLFMNIHTFNPAYQIKAWLYVIIRREVARKQKRQSRERDIIEYVDQEQSFYGNICLEEAPEETYDDVHYAVSLLPPIERRSMEMRLQEYKTMDIARLLFQEGVLDVDSIHIVKYHIKKAYH